MEDLGQHIEAVAIALLGKPASIEQGRWRDELRIHSLKMHDAPKTLGLFTEALTRSLAAFRDVLPGAVLVAKDEFLQWGNRQPALTVPARDLTGIRDRRSRADPRRPRRHPLPREPHRGRRSRRGPGRRAGDPSRARRHRVRDHVAGP